MPLNVDYSANDTLITVQECVDFTPVDGNSYAEQRRPFIAQVEEILFFRCFGPEFYNDLMADKVKYSFTAGTGLRVYVNFNVGTSYTAGQYVLHQGRMYKVLKNTTGAQHQAPTNQEYFERAEKFVNPSHEFLWVRYLRGILATAISTESLPFRLIQDSAQGLVQKFTKDETKPLDVTQAFRIEGKYAKMIDERIRLMEYFISNNEDEFPNYRSVLNKNKCDSGCKPKAIRNLGFNVNEY